MSYNYTAGPVLVTGSGGIVSDNSKRPQSAVPMGVLNPVMFASKAIVSVPATNAVVVGQQMYRPQLPPGTVMVQYPVMQAAPNGMAMASPNTFPPPPSGSNPSHLPMFSSQLQQPPPAGLVYYVPMTGGNFAMAGYSVVGSNGNISHVAANGPSPPIATPPTPTAGPAAVANHYPVPQPLVRYGANGLPIANGGVMPPMVPPAPPSAPVSGGLYSRPPPALPPQINPALFQSPPPPIVKAGVSNNGNFTLISAPPSHPFMQQQQVKGGPVFAYNNGMPTTAAPVSTHPMMPVILTNGGNMHMPPSPGVGAPLPYNPHTLQQSAPRFGGPPVVYQQAYPPRSLS